MNLSFIGWDLGGAHLKAAGLDAGGRLSVAQAPTPLWLGLNHLETALDDLLTRLNPTPDCRHLVTMTGELADCFENRAEGVMALVDLMRSRIPADQLRFFAGASGFLPSLEVEKSHWERIASANWLATAYFAASRIPEVLLIDIGSTTTDLILIQAGQVSNRGYTDQERMRYDELVYTGVVRTPLMALCSHIPFAGESQPLMAELFATTADVYRLTGELSETADQSLTADGGAKTLSGSARRLARHLGCELESASLDHWRLTARFLRERQLTRIQNALERQLSRALLRPDAPFIGAGIGRFLIRDCAARLGHPYQDLTDLFPPCISSPAFSAADCAPAAALACLAASNWMTQ